MSGIKTASDKVRGRKPYDLRNKRFGSLIAIETPKTGYWRCVCDCGKEVILRTGSLTSQGTKSCGCLTIATAKSKQNITRLKKANTRAGRRKCRRCKEVWNRPRGETAKNCPECRSRCHRCNIKLTTENWDKTSSGRRQYVCKSCVAEVVAHTKGNAGFKQRDYDLLRNYGITAVEYDAMLASQNGVCFICQLPPSGKNLAVDHQHEAGEKLRSSRSKRFKVRGLLCWRCNAGLSKYRDDPKRLRQAAEYLENWPSRKVLPEKEEQ